MTKAIGACASRARPTSPTCSMSWAKFHCLLTSSARTQPDGAGPPAIPNRLRASPPARSPPQPPACISPNRCWPRSAARGVQVCFLTLHVGLGTFAPVKAETIAAHTMHEERYELSEETARAINEAKSAGRRVIAVGTTTVRVLESARRAAAARTGSSPAPASTRLRTPWLSPAPARPASSFIPPYDFRIADALLTNFHLPRSTLLMLVSAFAAPERHPRTRCDSVRLRRSHPRALSLLQLRRCDAHPMKPSTLNPQPLNSPALRPGQHGDDGGRQDRHRQSRASPPSAAGATRSICSNCAPPPTP